MNLDALHTLPTIDELAGALRRGELTCAALVERCLARIERDETQVHAWVLVDEQQARHEAQACDRRLAAGDDPGPLAGIPLGIKDLFDVQGWPTRAGSALTDPRPVERDATVVARLRAAGAIFLGKTVTTEWACFDPSPTRNPWNLEHTPGGSSSGSAAATSLAMCAAALGSQTGGSITRPAGYCGVAGCKPTWSRVSLHGVAPISPHLDHPGPMARRVADLAALLQVIAGYDPLDPWSANRPVDDYRAQLGRSAPPRLGWVREFFFDSADADAQVGIVDAVGRLRKAGATIVEARLPACFARVIDWHRTIMAVEAAATHRELYPAKRAGFPPHVARLLDDGLATSTLDYAAALAGQRLWRRSVIELLENLDALIMPATLSAAPAMLDSTGDPRFQSPWSLAGAPTVSLPTGLAPDGLPLAAQLVGAPWGEAHLFGVAAWCERVWAFDHRPSGLSPAGPTAP